MSVLIAAVYFAVTKYLPLLITQIVKMVNSVLKFYQSQDGSWLIKQLNHYISAKTVTAQVKHGINLAFFDFNQPDEDGSDVLYVIYSEFRFIRLSSSRCIHLAVCF